MPKPAQSIAQDWGSGTAVRKGCKAGIRKLNMIDAAPAISAVDGAVVSTVAFVRRPLALPLFTSLKSLASVVGL